MSKQYEFITIPKKFNLLYKALEAEDTTPYKKIIEISKT